MKRTILLCSLALACLVAVPAAGWFVGDAVHAQGVADGADAAVPDQATVASPAPISPATLPTPPDVLDDPAAAVKSTREVYKDLGLVAAIAFGAFVLLSTLAKRATPGSVLDRGRWASIIAASASTAGFLLLALKGSIGWDVAMGGALIAWGTVLNPAPPAKPAGA